QREDPRPQRRDHPLGRRAPHAAALMARLGVIGAGNIGGAIAANLLADGHERAVHDVDATRTAPLAEKGAAVCASPAAVGERSEITFTSLPTPAIMQATAGAWGGGAARGAILVGVR